MSRHPHPVAGLAAVLAVALFAPIVVGAAGDDDDRERYTLTGASPLPRGRWALRISGGLTAFVPEGVAGVTPLADAFTAVMPRGSLALGVGAGEVDAFALYGTTGGFIHRFGGQLRLRWLETRALRAALAVGADYELRAFHVESLSYAGALRVLSELRAEADIGDLVVSLSAGVLVELMVNEHIGGSWHSQLAPLLAAYDTALALEWPWGETARFFLRAAGRFAREPSIQLDRAAVTVEAGAGFPL